jgi:hypothetical protein
MLFCKKSIPPSGQPPWGTKKKIEALRAEEERKENREEYKSTKG